MVPRCTMSLIERPRVSSKNVNTIREIVKYPKSSSFNDILTQVLENYLKLENFYRKHKNKGILQF